MLNYIVIINSFCADNFILHNMMYSIIYDITNDHTIYKRYDKQQWQNMYISYVYSKATKNTTQIYFCLYYAENFIHININFLRCPTLLSNEKKAFKISTCILDTSLNFVYSKYLHYILKQKVIAKHLAPECDHVQLWLIPSR